MGLSYSFLDLSISTLKWKVIIIDYGLILIFLQSLSWDFFRLTTPNLNTNFMLNLLIMGWLIGDCYSGRVGVHLIFLWVFLQVEVFIILCLKALMRNLKSFGWYKSYKCETGDNNDWTDQTRCHSKWRSKN